MTVYADHTQDPDSILIPSTNGLRSAARIHGLVPHSRNHSRQSSVSEDGLGWGTPPRQRSVSGGSLYGIATASSPQLSTPAPRRASGRRTLSSVHLPPEPSSGYTSSVQSPNVQTTYSPSSPNIQTIQSPNTSSNQYLSSPVRPILSSVPAEPSTPAYNLLSAIVTRTPGTATDSESEGRRLPEPRARLTTSESQTRLAPPTDWRLAPPTDSRLSVDSRVPRIESQISPGLDKRPRHLSENDMGTVRGKGSAGWVAPMLLAGQKRGDSTGEQGNQGAGLVRSHSARVGDHTPRSGTSSQSGSKPPTPSRTSTNSSVPHGASPHRSGSTASSNRGGAVVPSPNRGVRHPFLAGGRRRSISTEDDRALQRYRSADALRKILDDAAAKRRQEEEEEERARLAATAEQESERGRKPLARPTWSMIPRRGTTVAVETVAPAGMVSIEGITGTGGSSGKNSKAAGRQVDPLVLPGEFWAGPVTAEPRSMRQDSRQDTLMPGRQDTLTLHPESPTRQRSQSMGPVTRFSSLLPKISVFGKAGIGEPPPTVDKGKGKAVDEDEGKAKDIPRSRTDENSRFKTDDLSKTPVAGPSFRPEMLSVHLNGALLDNDADTTTR
ncbi:hypothetical protein B0J17DRAFT_201457 [Rhizoctonia solani]|nr:hypothetical protein B0J17DRAFT_201457 [Rhizoctonia solani]